MATPGTFISTVGHTGLIVWLVLGWGFNAEPLRIETMDVTVVSGEEFEALVQAARTPEPGQAQPDAPVQPVVDDTPPTPPAEVQPTEPAPPPEPVEPPVEEAPPPPPPPAPPVAEVADAPPVEPAPPAAPPPTPDLEISQRPTPRQAPTVASTISEPPPPDAQVDDVVREEVVPDQSAEAEVVQEEQEATAPEETTTEIVIADERPSGAIETSIRPVARPNRPAPPAPQPEEPETQTAEADTPPVREEAPDNTIEDLLAGVVTDEPPAPQAPDVPAGPPMTGAERDSFRVAVNRCWNVDPGSVAARVTVEVGFSLDRDGRVLGNEVRLLSSDGDQSATNTAFEAARRAILRCQSNGYQLPADKYGQWKDVVITFDPSGMRLR